MFTRILAGVAVVSLATLGHERRAEAGLMCYGCCSSTNEIWTCCDSDPWYQHHALPCYAWGLGTEGPCHDNCVWGGCHEECPGGDDEEEVLLSRVMSGDNEALAQLIRDNPTRFVLNRARGALQFSSACGVRPRRLVGHIPLEGVQPELTHQGQGT